MTVVVIFAGIVLLMIYRFYADIRDVYQEVHRAAAPLKTRMLSVPQQYKDILQKYFRYYLHLSPADKVKFERNVCTFIYGKHFIPRGIPAVPVELQVLIAACAVQLTFGLSHVYLRHFRRILVYRDDYFSSITKQYHKGEVNPRFGMIVLSWQSFVEGYINSTDARNLGLHEMAHALRLENIIRNEEYQFFDDELLKQLDDYCHRICYSEEELNDTFFRPYACTNVHEFFAVSVENFFERSEQFKSELPELYSIMVRLLNQDPMALKAG